MIAVRTDIRPLSEAPCGTAAAVASQRYDNEQPACGEGSETANR